MRITLALCAASLCVVPCAHGQSAIDPDAPLFYSIATKSETVDSWRFGIAPGVISEAYRNAHERFLSALQAIAGNSANQAPLLEPFSCLGRESSGGSCRHVVEVKTGTSDQQLVALLATEPTHSARVVELTVIFDGRFFQVPARMYEARVGDGGALTRSHELLATYLTTYSKALHREDIATHRNDAPFDGTIGSKEARMHFWSGGQSPRLPMELERSVRSLAALWAATLSPDATGVFAGNHSDRASLLRVRDVVALDSKPCKTLHPTFLVAKDLGDQLWLTFPGGQKSLWNNFLIEPRCGFDY